MPAHSELRIDARLDEALLLDETGQLRTAWHRAHEVARELEARDDVPPRLLARSALALGRLEAQRLHVEAAEQHFAEAGVRLRRRGERRQLLELHIARGEFARRLGRDREVLRELDACDALLGSDWLRSFEVRRLHLEARSLLAGDRAQEAIPLCERARTLALACGDAFGDVGVQVTLVDAKLQVLERAARTGPVSADELDACEARGLLALSSKAGLPRLEVLAHVLRAQQLRLAGAPGEAQPEIRAATEILRRHSVEATFPLRILLERARVEEALGKREEGTRIRKLARRRLELVTRRLKRADRPRFRRATGVRRALS